MPRWPSDWLGLSPEASHTARVAGSHRTNGFGFSNTVELSSARSVRPRIACESCGSNCHAEPATPRWRHSVRDPVCDSRSLR
ncbi:hypothetical protein BRN33_17500 [Xanthomonas oryzae pv. oryzae]|nr:hypothetical protein BRN33_17500 [Xanthomonas oryzae pv. oryzae]RBL21846.1 hypothetical protein BRN31_23445 [Xanthomonas oryzae pv. oryzae]UWU54886.1 hypothetical protein BRN95_23580 [Xanthomonas oryzae pv. oryzae]